MKLPEISSYGNYESDNYGAHTLCVDFDSFRLYYSYKTIVAFYDSVLGLVVCENRWGVTTGKHLNWIQSDKKKRVKSEQFDTMLKAMLERRTNQND